MKTKNTKTDPATSLYISQRRQKNQKSKELLRTMRGSVATKLQQSEPDLNIISLILHKLKEQLSKLKRLPKSTRDSIIKGILAIVEEHLKTFVREFPDLYSDLNRVSNAKKGLEVCLGKAAKKQESDVKKCYKLLEQLETLLQGSARTLIQRYRTKNSDMIAHKRISALYHLRSVLPQKYSAANGCPIQQVKHVLTKQLKYIFDKHKRPIKQSSRIRDSLACEISGAVRDALKFHTFDMNDSLQSTKRRTTSR